MQPSNCLPLFDTRRAAYERITGTKPEIWDRIMAFAVERGCKGLTADEVAALWECSANHVAPRITELKADGMLVPTNRTRLTRAGSRARVLIAKQFAPPMAAATEAPSIQHSLTTGELFFPDPPERQHRDDG